MERCPQRLARRSTTPPFFPVGPAASQALVDQNVANVAPVDADGRKRPAITPPSESLNGPVIAVEQLKQSAAGFFRQALLGITAANICIRFGRVEIHQTQLLAVQPKRIAVDQAHFGGGARFLWSTHAQAPADLTGFPVRGLLRAEVLRPINSQLADFFTHVANDTAGSIDMTGP